ncbi:hypothetical protein [Candidatus Berkiella aquae]|uniref:WipA-like phosphatase domain-containing protein n=1 Tax=Candidatus Berkiella aquae TaxID=295108 RepID=A0A0Q9YMH0_9GAMM|nr:hypothetical protein [Candidatus Berkiella aquae]MCS5710338.1 hypothetical protein [Candidatus Berkiella aquae]
MSEAQLHQESKVNILEFPSKIEDHQHHENLAITMGDAHGNVLSILHSLIREGLLLGITKEEYEYFAKTIYQKEIDELTEEDISAFQALLHNDKSHFNPSLKNVFFQMVGDEAGDRGKCDLFVWLLMEKMVDAKILKNVSISNHTIEPLKLYERGLNFQCGYGFPSEEQSLLMYEHACSMQNLQVLIDSENFPNITRPYVDNLIKKIYEPTLRLFFYNLNEKGDEITFFSHAGVGLETIEEEALKFNVPFKDGSAKELAQTIDNINKHFTENYVEQKRMHELFPAEEMSRLYSGYVKTDNPFVRSIWNRIYDENYIKRPAIHNGFKINYAHGHDSGSPNLEHCFNIDNSFGKMRNIADYKVLYTLNNQPVLELKAKDEEAAKVDVCVPQVSAPKLSTNAHNKDLDILIKFISRAKNKYAHLKRGKCMEIKKERIGSQYNFQVGVGSTSGLFYISNRNIHVALEENGTLSFYKKHEGIVDYKNKVNYEEVADENLLSSIVSQLKSLQAAKTQTTTKPILNQFAHEIQPVIDPTIESLNQVKAFMQKVAQSKNPLPGVCIPMQADSVGAQYDFQLGRSRYNNTLYIANRYFHAALEGDNVVFYPKVDGKVNHEQPLPAKDALQDNLFHSIVQFQQQLQNNKVTMTM